MLIKVFDKWLEPTGCRVYETTFEGEGGTMICGAGNWSIFIVRKFAHEVAAEINKQIKETK